MKLLIFIFFSFTFIACDIFDTRVAEEPGDNQTNNPPAIEETTLIQNLINSFSTKNTNDYLACFPDSDFVFYPLSQAISQYPFLIDDWGKDDERRHFEILKNEIATHDSVLIFRNTSYDRQPDSTFFSGDYEIIVPLQNNDTLYYAGKANFTMKRDFGEVWKIFRWQDFKSGGLPSWSELKGRFY